MKTSFTKGEIDILIEQLSLVFETVILKEKQEEKPHAFSWQSMFCCEDDSDKTSICREIEVDGKDYILKIVESTSEKTLSPREIKMQHDDSIRDALSGVYNGYFWEDVFCAKIPELAKQGTAVSVAVFSIDNFEKIKEEVGKEGAEQLLCYVANQWKRFYDEDEEKVVCRLDENLFALGCVGAQQNELEYQMRAIYEKMNLNCTMTFGMFKRVSFTLSISCACTDEVNQKAWGELSILCNSRLASVIRNGGNAVHHVSF